MSGSSNYLITNSKDYYHHVKTRSIKIFQRARQPAYSLYIQVHYKEKSVKNTAQLNCKYLYNFIIQ